jgi:hypothetical protein
MTLTAMKTGFKIAGLVGGLVLCFSSCSHPKPNPGAELAKLSITTPGPQPAWQGRTTGAQSSFTDFLIDCESRLDQLKNCLSAGIGQPRQTVFPR